MNFLGILIGTGILWLLNAVIVMPIAKALSKNRMKVQMVPPPGTEVMAEGEGCAEIQAQTEVSTGIYVLVDVLVLGTAGFIMGIVWGWFFIGFTWQAKGWPGMITFIGASIIGSIMHG